ncbi:unnamed protein product [Triticum turgidum subsp. durum]|uniref:Uncharacterized protein n=1 Tax=Triticum turgidum subsp. durum TaxID=4567 RepID=A0A9R0WC06_TRITD|nr:unnamed protein product [Triticum turgidum subsp. durum]
MPGSSAVWPHTRTAFLHNPADQAHRGGQPGMLPAAAWRRGGTAAPREILVAAQTIWRRRCTRWCCGRPRWWTTCGGVGRRERSRRGGARPRLGPVQEIDHDDGPAQELYSNTASPSLVFPSNSCPGGWMIYLAYADADDTSLPAMFGGFNHPVEDSQEILTCCRVKFFEQKLFKYSWCAVGIN